MARALDCGWGRQTEVPDLLGATFAGRRPPEFMPFACHIQRGMSGDSG